MIKCICNIKVFLATLWRTLVRMFVKGKKHIYIKDVDKDGVDEIIIDPNGESKGGE